MSFAAAEPTWQAGSKPETHPGLRHDAWLTKILRRPCYSVSVPGAEEAALALRVALPANAFLFTKISANDRVRLELCEHTLGFTLADTSVTLERRVDAHAVPPDTRVRAATGYDADAVAEIAANSFAVSRFHTDPKIPAELANRVKAQWARNFFSRQRGDLMFVALSEGQPSGFCQLLHREDAMIIDLIAVGAAARRQGLASDMIAAAHVAARERHCQWLRVGTQLINTASLRCYEGLGFRVSAAHHVFHCHTNG